MGKMTFIVILAVLAFNISLAQPAISLTGIDKVTYDLYLGGEWRELIRTGEAALKSGTDYYYLRMRIGIAYFETKNYPRAIRHFRKALEFNSSDDTAKEYLFFAYTFQGRDMEAHNIALGFTGSLKNKLSYKRSGTRSFTLHATGSFLRDPGIIDDYAFGNDTRDAGFQTVTRDFKFFGASLEHDAGRLIKLTHSAGYLAKSYLLYYQDETRTDLIRDKRLSQFQYYLSPRILLGNSTFLIPAIHYLNIVIPYETTVAGRFGRTYQVKEYTFNHDVATSVGLEKYIGRFRPGIAAGYSYINRQPLLQGSFSCGWFPLGNLNLYSISDITGYSFLSGNNSGARWIYSQEIGFRAFPGLWMELGGSWGERENFAGALSYIIYNDYLITREHYSVTMITPFYNSGVELSLSYGYNIQQTRFIPEYPLTGNPINPIEINNHKLSGGIKWRF
jgi:hypothetical protein